MNNPERVLGVAAVRRLQKIVGDRTDAVVAVTTPTGELQWASAAGSKEMFDRQLGDFAGRSMFDFVHPDDEHLVRRSHERAVSGETVRYAVRGSMADGDWRQVTVVAWPVHATTGLVVVSVTVPGRGPSDVD